MVKNFPTLNGFYQAPNIEGLLFGSKKLPIDAELCYANNPNSLFKKYSLLITWFANHPFGRSYLGIPQVKEKIGLLTPNGYHLIVEENKDTLKAYFEFTTRAIYASLLLPALQKLDQIQLYIEVNTIPMQMIYFYLLFLYPPLLAYLFSIILIFS